MMSRYAVAALVLISSLGLPGCSTFQSENVTTLCEEAMTIKADQLRVGTDGRARFLRRCSTEADIYTEGQWKCIITEMKRGKPYAGVIGGCLKG